MTTLKFDNIVSTKIFDIGHRQQSRHENMLCEISLFSGTMPKLTSFPSLTFISCATLEATDMAATLRGCVQPIFMPPWV